MSDFVFFFFRVDITFVGENSSCETRDHFATQTNTSNRVPSNPFSGSSFYQQWFIFVKDTLHESFWASVGVSICDKVSMREANSIVSVILQNASCCIISPHAPRFKLRC